MVARRRRPRPEPEPAVEVLSPEEAAERREAELLSQKLVKRTNASALTILVEAPPPDQNPVFVYLARLAEGYSRNTMYKALKVFTTPYIPEMVDWGTLCYQHVSTMRGRLMSKLASTYVNKILSAVRGVAQEAMRLRLLPTDEYVRIRDVKGVKGERLPAGRHVEEGEVTALFQTCEDDSPKAVRDRAVLAVLRATGCRRSELVALKVEDVDQHTWSIVAAGKGNKERLLPALAAKEALMAWFQKRKWADGPLFCAVRKNGKLSMKAMDASSVALIIKRAGEAAKVDRLSPHDMRRTLIGDLLDKGVDISTVQKIAGHARVTTTQRYDRRPARAMQAAASLIEIPSPRSRRSDG